MLHYTRRQRVANLNQLEYKMLRAEECRNIAQGFKEPSLFEICCIRIEDAARKGECKHLSVGDFYEW